MYILYIWPLFWKSQKLMHAPIVVGRFPATWPGEKSPYLMGKWYKIHTHTNSSTSGEFFRQVRCFFPLPCHNFQPDSAHSGCTSCSTGSMPPPERWPKPGARCSWSRCPGRCAGPALPSWRTQPGTWCTQHCAWAFPTKKRGLECVLENVCFFCFHIFWAKFENVDMFLYHGTLGSGTIISVWCWVVPSPPVIPNPNLGCSSGMV